MKSWLILSTALCAACAASNPAPIDYGGSRAPRPASEARTIPEQTQPQPDWASGEGTALSDFALRIEDAQPFHPARIPRTHRVAENESLYDIATRYQIPLETLAAENNLAAPFSVSRGQVLALPRPRVHRIERGESFADVAQRFHIDPRSLALLNRMQPPYQVREGDALVLPAIPGGGPPAPSPAASASETPTARAVFAWPVRGEVLARFGRRVGGGQLDGVEIAALEGAPIGAADDGEVVYAGSDLPAYGTLVLLRHDSGYVTAYAHARRALVREGQRVARGEPIAEAGGDGKILFQVRSGRDAVDPLPLLTH